MTPEERTQLEWLRGHCDETLKWMTQAQAQGLNVRTEYGDTLWHIRYFERFRAAITRKLDQEEE